MSTNTTDGLKRFEPRTMTGDEEGAMRLFLSPCPECADEAEKWVRELDAERRAHAITAGALSEARELLRGRDLPDDVWHRIDAALNRAVWPVMDRRPDLSHLCAEVSRVYLSEAADAGVPASLSAFCRGDVPQAPARLRLIAEAYSLLDRAWKS